MKKIIKMIFLYVKQDHLIWNILSWKQSNFLFHYAQSILEMQIGEMWIEFCLRKISCYAKEIPFWHLTYLLSPSWTANIVYVQFLLSRIFSLLFV